MTHLRRPSLELETDFWRAGHRFVAGADEAGRGCLAGPVVAAAVVLREGAGIDGLDDSKKLSPEKRDGLLPLIYDEAIDVAIGLCSPEEIDDLNILYASLEAMRRALCSLKQKPSMVLVDGNTPIPAAPCEQLTVVGGDGRSLSIAAASVVAKVTRDRMMVALDAEYPEYGWIRHKGYPTAQHYRALATYGASPHHRRSFRLIR